MWNIDPKILCNKHLLGEHVEMHMFVGCINKGTSLRGYIDKNLVEVHNIHSRHEDLVNEMTSRNMSHKSILPDFKSWKEGNVLSENNLQDLTNRCQHCRERYNKYNG